jgi:hypothetical protein
MTTELRDYRIKRGKLEQFVGEWWAGVVPLREAHGYHVDAAWTVAKQSRFVWLLSRDVPSSEWETCNDAYYADPRRAALDPDPARFVLSERRYLVEAVTLQEI